MSWLYEHQIIDSEVNGKIDVFRYFGRWQIKVGDAYLTAEYTKRKFKRVISELPPEFKANSILVLGSGGGSCFDPIYQRFSDSEILGIEYDLSMIELMFKLNFTSNPLRPQILHGDVKNILPFLKKRFDLIIVDLFFGRHLAPAVYEGWFFPTLNSHLNGEGLLLMNFFQDKNETGLPCKEFLHEKTIHHVYNTLGLYRKKPKRIVI